LLRYSLRRLAIVALASVWFTTIALICPASAQVTPAASYTPPDDTPSIKVGATIFADYTFQSSPETTDADGNMVHANAFNVTRAYININGRINHIMAFRITPDISRETGSGSSLAGSQEFRLKYAFMQINLDDWMPKGSWIRLGVQQTPVVDYQEGIYRYRFQGTVFPERSGLLSSSDAGVSFHGNFPNNYGDVHVGVYNGETYSKAEANNEKSFQIRGTLRPMPMSGNMKGLRVTAFYDKDAYIQSGPRNRFIFGGSYEHTYLNAGVDYINAEDQKAVDATNVKANGYSIWLTPRSTKHIEALIRFDDLKQNKDSNQRRKILIGGVSYWFPENHGATTALMFDVERYTYNYDKPDETRIFVHALVNF
jgi:Phosphate-selective porin O and P